MHFRVTQIKTYSWDNAQVILVGNKADFDEERLIRFINQNYKQFRNAFYFFQL
jgi:hypothetical protein